MSLNLMTGDYFASLLQRDRRAYDALEMLVDDLQANKDRTVARFLSHSGSEDLLWSLVRLLENENSRVAGNSAYILGTLAEHDLGCYRVLSLANNDRQPARILPHLTHLLTINDAESVMNAAGTMGTLAESQEGRNWILHEPCLDETLTHITALLSNENLWTASNAALVLARISISEEGIHRILHHAKCDYILTSLVQSLGTDEAGRGMNAAFAIGRICDIENGRRKLLSLPESEKMVSSLAKMLCGVDTGASKNACFALSCLATNKEGHSRLLSNANSEEVLKTLSQLLSDEDPETGWFAAMTLRTLASLPKGCLRLRENRHVVPALKGVVERESVSQDLLEEVEQAIEILRRLEKPNPPVVQVSGSDAILITWEKMTTKSGFPIKYQLFEDASTNQTQKAQSTKEASLLWKPVESLAIDKKDSVSEVELCQQSMSHPFQNKPSQKSLVLKNDSPKQMPSNEINISRSITTLSKAPKRHNEVAPLSKVTSRRPSITTAENIKALLESEKTMNIEGTSQHVYRTLQNDSSCKDQLVGTKMISQISESEGVSVLKDLKQNVVTPSSNIWKDIAEPQTSPKFAKQLTQPGLTQDNTGNNSYNAVLEDDLNENVTYIRRVDIVKRPAEFAQSVSEPDLFLATPIDNNAYVKPVTPTPAHVQRAQTYISSHRPRLKSQPERRHIPRLMSGFGGLGASQWTPELPGDTHVEHHHTKFVPSQFRTQPANIPGGFQRQISNLSLFEGGQPKLRIDLVSRNQPSPEMRLNPAARSPSLFPYDEKSRSSPANKFTAQSKSRQPNNMTPDPVYRSVSKLHTSTIGKKNKILTALPLSSPQAKKLQSAQ